MMEAKGANLFGVFWGAYHGNSLITSVASQPVDGTIRYLGMG